MAVHWLQFMQLEELAIIVLLAANAIKVLQLVDGTELASLLVRTELAIR